MAFDSNPYFSVVTIDHTQVGGSLTDFLLYIDDLPADAFAEIHSTGKDIRFSDSTGTSELAFDLRAIDTTAGTCEIFVKIPTVSASVDTEIRIWYGDHTLSLYAAGDTYGRNACYSNFEAVFSLAEDASGAGGSAIYIDRTGNSNDGGDYVDATGKTGQVGSGQEFDGSNDYVLLPSTNFQTLTVGSVMGWVYPRATNFGSIFNHAKPTTAANYFGIEVSNNVLRINARATAAVLYDLRGNITSFPLNDWTHFCVGQDGAGIKMYVNGATETYNTSSGSGSSTVWMDAGATAATLTRLGITRFNGIDYRPMDGFLDEIWISTTFLDLSYTETVFNNQDSPATFFSVGTKQSASPEASFIPIITWFM